MDNNELEILDELLKYLNKTELNGFVELRNDTIKKSEFLKNVNNFTFKAALIKLTKDGYVTKTSKETIDPIFNTQRTDYYYDISFDGMFFIKNGGYRQALLEVQRKENAYDDLRNEQTKQAVSLLRLNRWLVFLTWIIALGTLIAAIYYLLEVLAFFGVLQTKKT